jgi:putative ABC transport system permease protein
MKRNKEVGIRKVLGALNSQLVSQFMTESFVLVLISALIALLAIELAAPTISAFTGFDLSLALFFQNYLHLFYLSALILLVAALAGIYPSVFMTRFGPGSTIRKAAITGQKGKALRNVLVVFQFSISIILVVLSLVVQDQLTYLQTKDLGFDKNNLIVLPQVQRLDSASRASLSASLLANPSVKSTGISSSVPPNVWDGDSFTSTEDADRNVPISYMHVNSDYLTTLGVEIIHGRAYRHIDEIENIVLNESAVIAMGWSADQSALGKKIVYQDTRFQIVGILKDFNYRSLDGPIEPLIMFQTGAPVFQNGASNISIRLNKSGNDVATAQEFLTFLETSWNEYAPNIPFDYQFTDQSYFQAFEFEQQLGTIFALFTALALIIACIGLLGLVSYIAEVRTKEIGIRKVLGATVAQILLLMGKDFSILIVISSIIATPIAWWAANQWLQNYEYQTPISSLVFIYAIVGALILALATVSYQAIKSALANPTDILHDE